jgi:hypothetical protein
MTPIGLKRAGGKPARSACQRTGHRPLSSPSLRRAGTINHWKHTSNQVCMEPGWVQSLGNADDGRTYAFVYWLDDRDAPQNVVYS